MKTLRPQTSIKLVLLCAGLLAGVLLVDLMIPLGVAGGVPYVAPVLVSVWSPRRRFTILVAVAGTLLTLLGLALSPDGGELWKVLANRTLAVGAIWVTAVLALQRKATEAARTEALRQREEALSDLRVLRGLLPICACCKKIRDDSGSWNQMESYIRDHSEADFTHSYCPQCAEELMNEE